MIVGRRPSLDSIPILYSPDRYDMMIFDMISVIFLFAILHNTWFRLSEAVRSKVVVVMLTLNGTMVCN